MAVGLLTVVELNPVAGLQEYVAFGSLLSPMVAPLVFDTQVFVKALPALTVGGLVSWVIVILAVFVQPLAPVTVRVYVPGLVMPTEVLVPRPLSHE